MYIYIYIYKYHTWCPWDSNILFQLIEIRFRDKSFPGAFACGSPALNTSSHRTKERTRKEIHGHHLSHFDDLGVLGNLGLIVRSVELHIDS